MDIVIAALLGFLQGISEWLPISSSGHLVIAQAILGVSVPAEFDIVIMAGTTLAIFIYFRQKIFELAKGLLSFKPSSWNYVMLIALAGIPTAIIGFAGRAFFKSLFSQPLAVCALLALNGAFLIFASQCCKKESSLNPRSAFIIGIAQGIATAPGISRSGSTIGAALLMGVDAKEAAIFSFFIGAPAMAIASALEFVQGGFVLVQPMLMLSGCLSAFLAGYASIDILMKILQEGRLHLFGYYCIAAAILSGLLIFLGVRLY